MAKVLCLVAIVATLRATLITADSSTTQLPGVFDNGMSNFFGAPMPFANSGNVFGNRQLAFMPGAQGSPFAAQSAPQSAAMPASSGQQDPNAPPTANAQQAAQSPFFMNNFNIPLLGDLGSILGNFGGAMRGQGNNQGPVVTTQPPDNSQTAAPASGGNWGSLFPGSSNQIYPQIPNFGFGGNPLPMKCYMGNSPSNSYNQQQNNQPCALPQEARYYFDMLKNQCVGQLVCPRFTGTGWSTQQNQGFSTAQDCINNCMPATSTQAAPATDSPTPIPENPPTSTTAAPVVPIAPAPQPAPIPEPAPAYVPDTVTLPAIGPTVTPFRLQ